MERLGSLAEQMIELLQEVLSLDYLSSVRVSPFLHRGVSNLSYLQTSFLYLCHYVWNDFHFTHQSIIHRLRKRW